MQEETSFIGRDPTTKRMQCVRSSRIYDAIVCPPGHFKRSEHDVINSCQIAGLECEEGFQCLCSPCVKAFDVDVFSLAATDDEGAYNSNEDSSVVLVGAGCPKMSLCGSVEQGKTIKFRAMDNKKRPGMKLTVNVHEGDTTTAITATPLTHAVTSIFTMTLPAYGNENTTNTSEEGCCVHGFQVATRRVGVIILEIFANGEQIPESPLRLEVKERDCARDTNNPLRVFDAEGRGCICNMNALEINGRCVMLAVLLPAIFAPLLLLSSVAVYLYVDRKWRQGDSVWAVKPSELLFGDPPRVVGRGTFGSVLLAEYRGTDVAVKRVIPPRVGQRLHGKGWINKMLGKGGEGDDGSVTPKKIGRRRSSLLSFNLPPNEDSVTSSETSRRQSFLTVDSTTLVKNISRRRSSVEPYQLPEIVDNGSSKEARSVVVTFDNPESGERDAPRRRSIANDTFDLGEHSHSHHDEESGLRMELGNTLQPEAITKHMKNPKHSHSRRRDLVKSGTFSSRWLNVDITSTFGYKSSYGDKKSTGSFRDRWFFFQKGDEYSRLKADFTSEMRHLSKLRHPCITTVMGAVVSKKEEPMLVMEYMDHGSLYDLLHNNTLAIDGELVLPILHDIAQGMRFLHAATPRVIHGDLKAQNVLVDNKFRAKVADFGLSQKKKIGATGTPFWMAPELLCGESTNTASSDVYSFGMVLYEVFSRQNPYEGEDHRKVLRQVADPLIQKRPPVPPATPPPVSCLMSECLAHSPNLRPTFEDLDLRLKSLNVSSVEPGEMIFSFQSKKAHQNAQRSVDLLFDVFPQHIAKALADGRKVEPESREVVTIFFSDIVGFASISSILSPLKVSHMLDRLYNRFDELSHRHDIFKVETIGDAYMAVTNLVKDQPDHAKRIAEFSVDAVRAASETMIDVDDPARGYVNIRVGFHSGPVVANVVGSRNPRYCLFGDTVNTASRMESTSIEGRIQCSDPSAALLRRQNPTMPIACRGEIMVKGKGEMKTYWVDEEPLRDSTESPYVDIMINSNPASATKHETHPSKKSGDVVHEAQQEFVAEHSQTDGRETADDD